MLIICGSDVVSWTTELDRPNIDVPWNTSSIRLSVFHHVSSITVTISFAPQDIWTFGYNMDVARLSNVMSVTGYYKDNLCSSGWYSDMLHSVVVGIATPTMERYTLGSRSIIMLFVIVWPDTWLSCYVTGTSIIWMSKKSTCRETRIT